MYGSIVPYYRKRNYTGRTGYKRVYPYRRPYSYNRNYVAKSITAARVKSCKSLVKSRVHYTVSFKANDNLPQLGYIKPKKGFVGLAVGEGSPDQPSRMVIKGIFKEANIENIVKKVDALNAGRYVVYDKDGPRTDMMTKIAALRIANSEIPIAEESKKRVKN